MGGLARIYHVRITQFVLKIEKLSYVMDARGSQDLRSLSLIMAPDFNSKLPTLGKGLDFKVSNQTENFKPS